MAPPDLRPSKAPSLHVERIHAEQAASLVRKVIACGKRFGGKSDLDVGRGERNRRPRHELRRFGWRSAGACRPGPEAASALDSLLLRHAHPPGARRHVAVARVVGPNGWITKADSARPEAEAVARGDCAVERSRLRVLPAAATRPSPGSTLAAARRRCPNVMDSGGARLGAAEGPR